MGCWAELRDRRGPAHPPPAQPNPLHPPAKRGTALTTIVSCVNPTLPHLATNDVPAAYLTYKGLFLLVTAKMDRIRMASVAPGSRTKGANLTTGTGSESMCQQDQTTKYYSRNHM